MLTVNGVFKLLSIAREGISEKTGEQYVQINSVSFEKKETYYVLVAFGKDAEYIKRCLNVAKEGEEPKYIVRRAMVSGNLSVENYEKAVTVPKKLRYNNEKLDVTFQVAMPQTVLKIYTNSVQFIDSKKAPLSSYVDVIDTEVKEEGSNE